MKVKLVKENISFERGLDPKKALGIGAINKILLGFEEASQEYDKFDVVAYTEDPTYPGIYIMIIRFEYGIMVNKYKTKRPNGMCIYDANHKEFIEEPADLEDYNTSYKELTDRYNFTFI